MLKAASVIEQEDQGFADYLVKQAKAIQSGKKRDFRKSDIAWVGLDSPVINFVVGAIESYDDKIGRKTSYHACLTIKNKRLTEKAQRFRSLMPDFIDALPCDERYKNEKTQKAPTIDFVEAVLFTGRANRAVATIAFALPNDQKVRERYGSRITQTSNLMDTKVAKAEVRKEALKFIDDETRGGLTWEEIVEGVKLRVMFHEYSHPLGVSRDEKGRLIEVEESLGKSYSAIEEAKANVVGAHCASVALAKGLITEGELKALYFNVIMDAMKWAISDRDLVADHAKKELMEFNYLFEKGAIAIRDGKYRIDYDKIAGAERDLAKELLEIKGSGDGNAAEKFVKKYAVIPEHMNGMLAKIDSLGPSKFTYAVMPEVLPAA